MALGVLMAAKPAVQSLKDLSGPQKCALLCVALGPDRSGEIFKQLSQEEVEQLTSEIVRMPDVPAGVVDELLQEFHFVTKSGSALLRGGVGTARRILGGVVGAAKASEVLERIDLQVPGSDFPSLRRATPEALLYILRKEHTQTVALVLAHLDREQAAQVVKMMDPERAAEVLCRMARLERVSPEVLRTVEACLGGRLAVSPTSDAGAAGGAAAVAKLLNQVGSELEERILKALESHDKETSERVKALMLVFEDLLMIDNKGVQRLLREIETKELALALKAASKELKGHIKANMSERAGTALEEEIELLGPVRVRDVEAAHARIIETVRRLGSDGEIVIRRQGANDEIIG